MGNIVEIVTTILSGLVIGASMIMLLVKIRDFWAKFVEKISLFIRLIRAIRPKRLREQILFEGITAYHATFPADFVITRAKAKPKYRKRQIEEVRRIVDLYSKVPLSDILKDPEASHMIHEVLSNPNQDHRDTEE